ncbi:MAG: 2-oxoglutarate dehydrogenase complex dihydrolipoyllysine-residue succinyltransferase [Cytophagaceae bacterium]|nr:2-oxoglutarate dehydrogenase complex dihydrolipoyllysine-residue succinyltransferase [Cytophagaceae bacterium]MDW8455786.1 2-oxoglutarate dehydrogenase complex dihydrolipoyllysine-residue succinyltransferase [Cytophagaceae bacterium]
MNQPIRIPAVGESISEVTIGKWNKKDGDLVQAEELLCELESDKATFEIRAEKSGILHIKAKEGDVLPIGAIVCEIETNNSSTNTKTHTMHDITTNEQKTSSSAQIIEVKVPAVGESISEVTVGNWNKKDGDLVQAEELLCELESDKATFELRADTAGTLQILAKTGDVLPIGATICKIQAGANPLTKTENILPQQNETQLKESVKNYPSPSAQKILNEKGIDSNDVSGTGKDGRITKEDALKAEKKQETQTQVSHTLQPQSNISSERSESRQRMSSLRKTVSRRLVAVKNETAMLTTFNEVDMKPIMDLRAKYKDSFKEKFDVGLGYMSFFTKACCQALLEFPAVNAYIDGDDIVYHNYCDISIAVSAPKGLMVPVIRNAEKMSFHEIEKEIVRLASRARENKLSIEEMQGGTFTITNGGVFGSMLSTPIINAPQSAILGMHNIVERPVVQAGQIVIRPIMYVALSYDHRIIDGRESVGFLVRVKQLLEDPARLLLGV